MTRALKITLTETDDMRERTIHFEIQTLPEGMTRDKAILFMLSRAADKFSGEKREQSGHNRD